MDPQLLFERYQDLQRYSDWSDDDVARILQARPFVIQAIPSIVDDFYREIQRHEATSKVVTGGEEQIARLQESLRQWLLQLVSGEYDLEYVQTRWQVGLRHAQIGLQQTYTNMAMSRLRRGILQGLREAGPSDDLEWPVVASINKLLDLDLAIIEDSFEHHRMQKEKRAERERSEQKFRNLVEAAACMIMILRDDYGIVYFSPFAERLTGFAASEIQGQSFLEVLAAARDDDRTMVPWNQLINSLPVADLELPIRCRDRSTRWLLWNALRLEEFDGQPAVIVVGHDITEKRRASERLLQAERLAAIGQTITGLAHEGRNALQRINSCTEMLEFEVDDRPEAMKLIHRLHKAQDDLTRLFDEVRSFAAPINLDKSRCAVDSVWREAWQLVQHEAMGRQARLIEATIGSPVEAVVDRFRMVQVFRNLFENSLAACTDPVEIRVRCGIPSSTPVTDGPPPPNSAASQDWLEIHVEDNGPGLSPAAQRDVFQPFFTTKAKGTGLGMAIAERVLAAHGGSIELGSPSGRTTGAHFVLTIPRG